MKARQPVKLHGVDVRIMNEEQAWHLNRMKMKQNIHIAWDLPRLDLTDRLKEMQTSGRLRNTSVTLPDGRTGCGYSSLPPLKTIHPARVSSAGNI